MGILLLALAACGNVPRRAENDRQGEISDGSPVPERKQPMLLRAVTETPGGAPCLFSGDTPSARYARIFALPRPGRFSSCGRLVRTPSGCVREIDLEVFRFGFAPGAMTVRKGERVRIRATSRDVLHGVAVREYGIRVPVYRGRTRIIEFVADKTGDFIMRCPVYCGQGHGQMVAHIIVEE